MNTRATASRATAEANDPASAHPAAEPKESAFEVPAAAFFWLKMLCKPVFVLVVLAAIWWYSSASFVKLWSSASFVEIWSNVNASFAASFAFSFVVFCFIIYRQCCKKPEELSSLESILKACVVGVFFKFSNLFVSFAILGFSILFTYLLGVYASFLIADQFYLFLCWLEYTYCASLKMHEFYLCGQLHYVKLFVYQTWVLWVICCTTYGLSQGNNMVSYFSHIFRPQPQPQPQPGRKMRGPDQAAAEEQALNADLAPELAELAEL